MKNKTKTTLLLSICFVMSLQLNAQWVQLGEDLEGDLTYEYYGRAMDLSPSGDIVAIGSQANPENFFVSFVRVFKEDAGTWQQIGTDIAAGEGDNSDDIALSADGKRVAIGSIRNGVINGFANFDGHVRIFDFVDNDWQQVGDDIIGTAQEGMGEALSLSADGKVLAVGIHFNDENGMDAGQVRVYRETNGVWQQIGDLINGDAEYDNFGYSIDISADGSIIAMGAPFNNTSRGQVKVYRFIDNNWQQIGSDILGDNVNDILGHSVSLNKEGNILAIGAIQEIAISPGFVSIYQNIGDSWQQIGNDISGDQINSLFGISVSLDATGNILATGASFNGGEAPAAGDIKVYENTNGTWTQLDGDIDGVATDDSFGQIACLSNDGSTLAGAGFLNDNNGYQAGHVRIFRNEKLAPTLSIEASEISVYPNPSNSSFFIEKAEGFDINIRDVNGKTLFSTTLKSNHAAINLAHELPSGIYFIQFQSNTLRYFVKHVVH